MYRDTTLQKYVNYIIIYQGTNNEFVTACIGATASVYWWSYLNTDLAKITQKSTYTLPSGWTF